MRASVFWEPVWEGGIYPLLSLVHMKPRNPAASKAAESTPLILRRILELLLNEERNPYSVSISKVSVFCQSKTTRPGHYPCCTPQAVRQYLTYRQESPHA
jgi:hypothetical protein